MYLKKKNKKKCQVYLLFIKGNCTPQNKAPVILEREKLVHLTHPLGNIVDL